MIGTAIKVAKIATGKIEEATDDGKNKAAVEFGRKGGKARADYQNHAIGWLQMGYSSLGGGKAVQFPGIWMSSGECRMVPRHYCFRTSALKI